MTGPNNTAVTKPAPDIRLVPAAVGAWATAALAVTWPPQTALHLAAVAAVAAVVIGLAARRKLWRGVVVLGLLAIVAAALATATHRAVASAGLITELAAERAVVDIEARLVTYPVLIRASQHDRYFVRLAVTAVSGRGLTGPSAATVLVFGDEAWADLSKGEQVAVTGRLKPTEGADVAVAQLTVTSPVQVIGPASPIDQAVTTIRTALPRALAHLSPQDAALLVGIVLGDTAGLSDTVLTNMQDTGLTHLTAVSGSHFAIVGGAVLLLTGHLTRRSRVLVTGAAMTSLVLVVGPEPSVLRGAVMGGIGLFGLLARRPRAALPALAAAIVLLVICDPWLGRSLGFILSVTATAALILVAPSIVERLVEVMPRPAAITIAAPLAAQLACAPILLGVNPGLTTYAVVANILAAPAVVPATICGLLAAVIAPWWQALAAVVAWPAGLAASWIGWVGDWLAGLPGARLPWPGGIGGVALLVAVTAACGIGLALGITYRPRWIISGGGFAVAAWLCWGFVWPVWSAHWGTGIDPQWQVAICDVGQGSATVLRSGTRSAVVIDVGPPGDSADSCLRQLRVDEIDLLVLSHPHLDHTGGLEPVVDNRLTRRALISPVTDPADPATQVLTNRGIPVQVASTGLTGSVGQVTWQVLWPGPEPIRTSQVSGRTDEDGADVNNASVVVLADVADLRVLTLGDLETQGADDLADLIASRDLAVDVVVAAHHGSAQQSARLVQAVSAPVAVFSVGADNPYGHPTPTALRLYGQFGTTLRTDECGTVALRRADNQTYVSGCRP